jgi:hypothetical protein
MRSTFTLFIAGLLLIGCKGPKEDSPIDVATSPNAEHLEEINTECFQFISEKDTIQLMTLTEGTKVTGTLDYAVFEKDRNSGFIKGEIREDLMIAEYTFMSEGDSSKRQVVFRKTEEGWKEGYGKMKSVDDIPVQVNIDSLDFSHQMTLAPIPCD